jgi:hypothetical protein
MREKEREIEANMTIAATLCGGKKQRFGGIRFGLEV